MKKVGSVYDAWKAGVLDKFLAGEDESDHSSPAILNVSTPVDLVLPSRPLPSGGGRIGSTVLPAMCIFALACLFVFTFVVVCYALFLAL